MAAALRVMVARLRVMAARLRVMAAALQVKPAITVPQFRRLTFEAPARYT